MSHLRLTTEEVDKAISKVEKRYQNGNEDLYELRMNNLNAIRDAISSNLSERPPKWKVEKRTLNRNKIKKP